MRYTINGGHGPTDPGAIGPKGLEERDVAKAVALAVCDLLTAAGHEAQFVQSDDLQEICDLSNAWESDAFISIHCNGFSNPAANGFEVWTSPGQTAADQIAESIFSAYQAAIGLAPRTDTSDGDSDKEGHLYVVMRTECPAVLVELAFITNPHEETLLASPDWQQQAAQAIVTGLVGGM